MYAHLDIVCWVGEARKPSYTLAIELLLKSARIPENEWPTYNQKAIDIIELLGSHTLALIQAGAFISKDHQKLEQYPKNIQTPAQATS